MFNRCNLHFWQNDHDIFRATVVTEEYTEYASAQKNALERKKKRAKRKRIPSLLPGFEPATPDYEFDVVPRPQMIPIRK